MGYWVDKIFTGASGMRKAPGSGGKNLNNGQPVQPVALAARSGGGIYLALAVQTGAGSSPAYFFSQIRI